MCCYFNYEWIDLRSDETFVQYYLHKVESNCNWYNDNSKERNNTDNQDDGSNEVGKSTQPLKIKNLCRDNEANRFVTAMRLSCQVKNSC